MNVQLEVRYWDGSSRVFSHNETESEIRDTFDALRAVMVRHGVKPAFRAVIRKSVGGTPVQIFDGPCF